MKKKTNLWLTAPKGATPVNLTSATDWQMAVRRDNVISIKLRLIMSTLLIRSAIFQSSSYPIVLTRKPYTSLISLPPIVMYCTNLPTSCLTDYFLMLIF